MQVVVRFITLRKESITSGGGSMGTEKEFSMDEWLQKVGADYFVFVRGMVWGRFLGKKKGLRFLYLSP